MSERILERARAELDSVRQAPSTWADLDVHLTGPDPGGDDTDGNEVRRALVLWGLQYDRRADDLPLLRVLVEQETRWCRTRGSGLGEVAELAGFLLAEHRRVEDVWRHWALKQSNFDTACGYDEHYLVAAGVPETIEHVRGADRPDQAELLGYLVGEDGTPLVLDPELPAWWEQKRSWFPADPGAEEPQVWMDRAVLLGDTEEARELLDRWGAAQPADASTLATVATRLTELGDAAAAAEVTRERIALHPDDSSMGMAGDLLRLAELERRAGAHRAAWAALRRSAAAMAEVPDWPRIGLGRAFVAELFELAAVADRDLAVEVWTAAEQALAAVQGPVPVPLDAAVVAAERVAPDRAAHFRALRDGRA